MKLLKTLRDWFTGKSDDDEKKKKRDAVRVTNYGGGVTRNSTTAQVKESIRKAEKVQEKRQEQATNAFKATPPSVKKAEARDKATAQKKPLQSKNDPLYAFSSKKPALPKTQSDKLREQMKTNIEARKAFASKTRTPTKTELLDPKVSRLAEMKHDRELANARREWLADLQKKKVEAKYPAGTRETKLAMKTGAYASDPEVAKYETLKYPIAVSAARGGLSGVTFGASELAIKKLPKSKEAEDAERFYQANKNQTAETIGELAGSLASFGGTSAATEKLGAKLTPKLASRLAEKQFVKNAAGRLVEKGVEKGVIGEATEELIRQVGKDKATKIATALGNDVVQNLTTGALYDVNKASAEYEVGSKEWWKELGKSAAMNSLITTGIAGGSAITGGRQLVQDAADMVAKRATVRKELRPFGNLEPQRQRPRIGESIEDRIARVDAERLGTNVDDAVPSKVDAPEPRQLNLQDEINKIDIEPKTDAPKAEVPNVKKAKSEPRVAERVEDFVGKSRQKVSRREKIKDFTKSVRTKLSDSLSAFEDEARKKSRVEMLNDYGAIDKVRRYKTIANRSVTEAQLKWDGNRFEDGKSLAQIFGGMDKETEKSFNAYLLLRHAPDRIREGKPIFDNMRLKNGVDLNDADACLAEAEKLLKEHPEFAEKAEDVYKYTRNELQNRVDAGLLPQEVADEWNQKYPYYVPTGREGYFNGVHGDTSRVTGAGELKAAKGSDYDIWDIKQQLSDATNRNWRDMSMNNMFRRMFGDRVASDLAGEADGGLEKVLDNTINLSKSKERGKYYANVYIDGELKRVEIEKRFYDGIEDMYKNGRLGNGIDVLNDAASVPAGLFKNLITEYSPIFMVKNFMRDFPEAVINSRQTKEFFECMPAATRDLLTGGEYSQALRDAGISQSTFIDFDKALKGGGKKGILALGNEYTELYPRLIEYMATIKKAGYDLSTGLPTDVVKAIKKDFGYDLKKGLKDVPDEIVDAVRNMGYDLNAGVANVPMEVRDRAAANAADVTVNFGRSGSIGKMLNRGFVPFFNPSVQGWSKFGRNITELKNASAKERLSFVLKATALGAGAKTINNYMLRDNQNYQMISARDKANNYIFPIGDPETTNKFIKIPSSRFAAVYGLPLVNAYNDNKMGWAEAFQIANDQVAPIDPLESNIFSQALQIKNNQTWYGTPIVPKALEDLPKSEQYDVNTSSIGKALGKATEKLPKELQISPKKADYAIDSLTGVAGDFLLPATTPSKKDKGLVGSVVKTAKRQFTIDTVTQNNLSTRFYDKLQDATSKNKSIKGGQAEADEYKRLNAYSTEISGVNKAIQRLQGSKRKTKLDDVRGLQEFRNQLMQDGIDGKEAPSSAKTMDAVQKYVGTTYAINNFGTAADKEAMRLYGMAKYGDISKQEMRKAINDDKDFYKGIKSIGKLNEKIEKTGIKSNTVLTKAVALASSGSNDELFGAYGATKQSRTESDNKMNRARTYFKDGGSEDEYVKLENARRTMGKLPEKEENDALNKLDKQLAKGEISLAEYGKKADSIEYNANISYLGLATSLAQVNAPERGYRLYDIKDKNIQKGINLAAMGFTARDYKDMSKALDTNGNGYPSKQEIIDYVNKSGVKDKATLFDALYYYQGKSNPFGTPTNYTREQAAAMGKQRGLKSISDDTGEFKLNPESTSGSGYSGYYRRGYRRWRRWGRRSSKGKASTTNLNAFKANKISVKGGAKAVKPKGTSSSSHSTRSSSSRGSLSSVSSSSSSAGTPHYKSLAKSLKTSNGVRADYNMASVKYDTASAVKKASKKKKANVKVEPPKVKFKKYEV